MSSAGEPLSEDELAARYGVPNAFSTVKEIDRLAPVYRAIVERSPFCVLATCGPEGLDASPRGDAPGFVRIVDDRTLVLPDRRGNDRIDSLRNVVRDPRVALLFFLPGLGTTLRVNGRGTVVADPETLASFAVDDKAPRSALVLAIERVYFQCARAIVRSHLWEPSYHVAQDEVPTPGAILAELSRGEIGGAPYDDAWPARAAATLW